MATYTYNAWGQRIGKVTGGSTERYAYDQANHLIGEYGNATNRDYIWVDDLPIAVIDNTTNGSVTTSTVNYIITDGLNSPRRVMNAAGTTIWSWPVLGNPFGEQQPTSSTGYVLNLRYPGQYYDAETNTNYNLFRTYEPAMGRYLQSDPLGLFGGQASTYVYAGNEPTEYVDFLGLQVDINTFPAGSSQWQGANNYQDPSGVFSVAGHGNPLMFSDSDLNPILPQDLAAMIKHNKHYKPGQTVYLLSCNTGVTPGKPWYPMSYAQLLANDLGSPVFAPNTFIWFNDQTGNTIVTGAQNANGPVSWDQTGVNPTNVSMNPNAPGSMVQFSPQH